MTRPTILISNDDGYQSVGIQTLARALAPLGDVLVCAPAVDQSAVSHAMSLRRPLRLDRQVDIKTPHGSVPVYAVDGTPTDAVYMAVHHILKERGFPTLVVSGINHGANLGDDVLYSGTVSAAMEGTLLGIPSVAVSLVGTHDLDFEPTGQFVHELCKGLLENRMPAGVLLNVNVPKKLTQPGFAVTRLGQHKYSNDVEERKDPRGTSYYWIGGQWSGYENLAGTDCKAVAEGHISVTPMEIKLTSEPNMAWLANLKVDQYPVDTSACDDQLSCF